MAEVPIIKLSEILNQMKIKWTETLVWGKTIGKKGKKTGKSAILKVTFEALQVLQDDEEVLGFRIGLRSGISMYLR